ncbi:hypothetical protein Btru_074996 [Bulinus truncatus]|nr:hypothetical protein Btru_074996 [Bulinus truncatus]
MRFIYFTALPIIVITVLIEANYKYSIYKKWDNVQFSNWTSEDLCPSHQCGGGGGVGSCALACSNDPTCSSFNFQSTLRTCSKNVGDIYKFGWGTLQASGSFHYVGKVQTDVTDGDWILVYRAQANNTVSTYSVYSNISYVSDADLSQIRLSTISKAGDAASAHFRSRWLNQWPSNVSQVKFELYTQGQTVLTLLFNGTGTNSTNWFSHSRLIQSPFIDLTWPPTMFSLTSYINNKRRFCITNATSYLDCSQKTWLLVEETLDSSCSWTSSSAQTFPRFLYSKNNNFTAFNTKTQGAASVLAIFIKF